jgi:hypothetical protein
MGFWIQPRQRVDGDLRFAVIGPDGLGLPLRLLTQTEAEQLAGVLNQYLDRDTEADMPSAGVNGPKTTVHPLPIRPCCFAR